VVRLKNLPAAIAPVSRFRESRITFQILAAGSLERLTRKSDAGSPVVTFLHLDLANHLDNRLQTIFDKT
jgi:hypothetical protein